MNMHEHVTLVQRPDPILFYHVLFPFLHLSLTRLCAGHKKGLQSYPFQITHHIHAQIRVLVLV